MAGNFNILSEVEFISSSTITVTHNLNQTYICARVIIDGELRNDLITSVTPSIDDPTNEFVVTLTSSQTGIIQVISSDVVPIETPSPLQAAELSVTGSTAAFSSYSTASTSITSSVSFTDLPLNVQRFVPDSGFYTHTTPNPDVTIVQAGRYLLSAYITIVGTSNSRTSSVNRIVIDTGSGFNPLSGGIFYGYHRDASNGFDTPNITGIFDFVAGTQLKLQSRIESGGNLVFVANGSGLTLLRLG